MRVDFWFEKLLQMERNEFCFLCIAGLQMILSLVVKHCWIANDFKFGNKEIRRTTTEILVKLVFLNGEVLVIPIQNSL